MLRSEIEKLLKTNYSVSRIKVKDGSDNTVKEMAREISENLYNLQSDDSDGDYLRKDLGLTPEERRMILNLINNKEK